MELGFHEVNGGILIVLEIATTLLELKCLYRVKMNAKIAFLRGDRHNMRAL